MDKKNTFSTYEARTKFSELLRKVQNGEEVIITNRQKEVAKLVPIKNLKEQRKPGSAKGSFIISDDFLDPLPEDFIKFFEV